MGQISGGQISISPHCMIRMGLSFIISAMKLFRPSPPWGCNGPVKKAESGCPSSAYALLISALLAPMLIRVCMPTVRFRSVCARVLLICVYDRSNMSQAVCASRHSPCLVGCLAQCLVSVFISVPFRGWPLDITQGIAFCRPDCSKVCVCDSVCLCLSECV